WCSARRRAPGPAHRATKEKSAPDRSKGPLSAIRTSHCVTLLSRHGAAALARGLRRCVLYPFNSTENPSMKKTLLAAALLAGFAGAAQAETSVTLYGVIDTGIGYNKIKGDGYDGSRIGMINGIQAGSRWGLRGSEDLGDGPRAVFQLASGLDSGNGNRAQGGRLFGRQATIGLANDSWGILEFGRQTNMASKYLADIDPFYTSYTQANLGLGASSANTSRWDNMVMYRTPSVNGFELGVGYSFNVDDGNADQTGFRTADNTRGITAGLRYLNGPLNITLTYDQLNGSNSSSQIDHDATPRQYAAGVS